MNYKRIFWALLALMFFVFLYSSFKAPDINVVQLHRPVASNVASNEIVTDVTLTELTALDDDQDRNPIPEQDYYTQALTLISRAEDGDVEAQFQLAEIISHCEGINAWKPDFEHDFSHFKAMNVSVADLRYMDNLMLEVQNCAAFAGQTLDIFSGQPLSGLSGLQIASLWYLQAAKQGHRQAAINALYFIQYITNADLETKRQVEKFIKAIQPSLTTELFAGLAAYADNELDQLAMVKLGCAGNVKCDSIDSVPLAHINFYGCMKSAVDDQIAGISTQPTDCAAQGLNHFIAEQSSKYSSDDLSARMQQIRQAAQQGDLQAMGLSGLAEWLQTDDTKK